MRNASESSKNDRFQIADSSPTGISIVEPATHKFIYVNKTALKAFGYKRSEIPGLVSPDIYWDLKDREEILKMLIAGKTVWDYELRLKKKNGKQFWVSAFVRSAIFDNKPAILCSFIDISNRKKVEESLRDSENKFRALVTAGSNNAIYIMNRDWSEMRYLGGKAFLSDTLKPRRSWLQTYILPEDQPEVMKVIAEAIASKGIFELEHRVIRKDGSVGWTHSRAVPLSGETGEIYEWFGVANDITERKHMEEDLKRHSIELQAANQDLEAFAYSISHDLRNPLHAIMGCCDVMRQMITPEDVDMSTSIELITASAEKMSQIIKDLMLLSRVTRREISPKIINLCTLAKDVIQGIKTQETERKVDIDIEPNIKAKADEGLMKLLLENLLHNAWKFTSKTENARIEFGKIAKGKSVIYFVRDNGAGFAMENADRLFKPFQRLHAYQDFKGTGIGLSIVKKIMDKHGGKVWAEAEKGKGATFFFELPP